MELSGSILFPDSVLAEPLVQDALWIQLLALLILLLGLRVMIQHDLLVNQVLVLVLLQTVQLKVEIVGRNQLCSRLIVRVM